MLDSFKQTGKNIGRELGRTWENLSEGWHELFRHSSNALTHFSSDNKEVTPFESNALATFPRWSMLAGEVEETDKEIVVRVETPGMEKEDCRITIDGNVLNLSGEKHFARETHDSTYHITERAYGAFQRTIPLPASVYVDKAEASYKNGVLSIRLPKNAVEPGRTIAVS